ncbi:hypothetical protein LIER_03403 [Lithospermum erythrorhizon]|uniref:CCHC-type domain-containing protein n=1 Tax=Lithospermum erythrorhizon TaxID=34254 RepID=A0AAV3NT06_LITER
MSNEKQDLTNMRLDGLIGNLTTFKMKFDSTELTKKKGVALKASCNEGDEEDLNDTMNMFAKSFNKTMKRFNRRPYTAGDNSSGKGVQCRECEGFGHIQVQCPKYVKKQTKSYYVTHSDKESNEHEGSDNVNNFVAFTAQVTREGVVNPSVSNMSPNNISDDEEDLTRGIKMMNSSTEILDEILKREE